MTCTAPTHLLSLWSAAATVPPPSVVAASLQGATCSSWGRSSLPLSSECLVFLANISHECPAPQIPWLIAIAFWLSGGFIRSGLGARIAYSIVSLFGKTTLVRTLSCNLHCSCCWLQQATLPPLLCRCLARPPWCTSASSSFGASVTAACWLGLHCMQLLHKRLLHIRPSVLQGLTYSLVAAEALLAPAIPSVAARAGGLFLPLAKALCLACGQWLLCLCTLLRRGAALHARRWPAALPHRPSCRQASS